MLLVVATGATRKVVQQPSSMTQASWSQPTIGRLFTGGGGRRPSAIAVRPVIVGTAAEFRDLAAKSIVPTEIVAVICDASHRSPRRT
jgi:hypothetical protein